MRNKIKRITQSCGKKNLRRFFSFFNTMKNYNMNNDRDKNIQVVVEIDGKLHRISDAYYDKDDMSIHIVASEETIEEPDYTPLWYVKDGRRIMREENEEK